MSANVFSVVIYCKSTFFIDGYKLDQRGKYTHPKPIIIANEKDMCLNKRDTEAGQEQSWEVKSKVTVEWLKSEAKSMIYQ